MRPSPAVLAGAAAAVVAVTAAVIIGARAPEVSPSGRRVSVAWAGAPPSEVKCVRAVALAQPEALELYGLPSDGGPQYLEVRVCGAPSEMDSPTLPAGMVGLEDTYREEEFGGGAQLWAAMAGEPELPCACSTGADCEALAEGAWVTAPRTGNTLAEGQWRGAGCIRKVCVELAGYQGLSVPEACRP